MNVNEVRSYKPSNLLQHFLSHAKKCSAPLPQIVNIGGAWGYYFLQYLQIFTGVYNRR